MKLDTAIWNLGLPLVLLAACGGSDDAAKDESSVEDDYYDYYDDYYDDYCGPCCDTGCPPPPECTGDVDCAEGYLCEANACVPAVDPPPTCERMDPLSPIPLLEGVADLRSLAFVDASPTPGRDLLVAAETGVSIVAADGTRTALASGLLEDPSAADLDGDGDEDVVATELVTGGWTLRTFLADGGGGWTPGPSTAVTGAVVDLVDLDGDGVVDLVTSGAGQVSWRRGLGGGGFDPVLPIATHSFDAMVVLPEGSVVFAQQETVSVASLASSWVEQPLEPVADIVFYGLAAGDFDGDGRTEVSGLEIGDPVDNVRTWRDPAGSPAVSTWATDIETNQVEVGDLDGDGLDDLVLFSSTGNIVMRFGLAGGADPFGCVRSGTVPGGWVVDAAIGDMDGDARGELVTYDGATLWSNRLP